MEPIYQLPEHEYPMSVFSIELFKCSGLGNINTPFVK